MEIKGEDVTIHYATKYLYKFTCTFEFDLFPFDVQLCSIEINLHDVLGECKPVWNKKSIELNSTADNIQMYWFRDLVEAPSSSDSSVKFKFLLKRIYMSYLMTTFGPCIVLCGLGSVSMIAFKIDDFTDRITITLSLLIVVAALFSQTVSTLPTSPSMKYVEIFFFYVILRLAYVFMMHTLVMISLKQSASNREIKSNLKSFFKGIIASKKQIEPETFLDLDFTISQENKGKGLFINKIGWIIGFVLDFIFIGFSSIHILLLRSNVESQYSS